MEVALTFGSVGDIIAICQIAVKLSQALGGSPCGSAREYQGLRKDLDVFIRVLSRVADAYSELGIYPQLTGLDSLIDEVITNCERLIQEFIDLWEKKFEDGLGGVGRPPRKAKKVWRSIQWSFQERERVRELREKLSQTAQNVTILTSLAAHQAARADNAKIMATTKEVNNHVGHVRQAVVNLEKAVSDPSTRVTLDTTKGMPLIIEDALRNTIEIPLDLVHSWEMFHTLLAHQFENRRGYQKVVQRKYALEEACTKRDLNRSLPWTVSVRRGMRIHMSIVFEDLSVCKSACPGCQAEYDVPHGVNFQCTSSTCGMWFRMQEGDANSIRRPVGSKSRRQNGKGKDPNTGDDAPSDFHRVRLLFPPVLVAHEEAGESAKEGGVTPRTVAYPSWHWRCCECRSGLFSNRIERSCPECRHARCANCTWMRVAP